jgi:hypothetical protein
MPIRTNIGIRCICSQCGRGLEADSNKCKFQYNNASIAEGIIAIIPCPHCYFEANKPIRILRELIGIAGRENGNGGE